MMTNDWIQIMYIRGEEIRMKLDGYLTAVAKM